MAGLSLYFEDGHDDLDDFGFDDYGSECDGIRITRFLDAGQDNLTPLGRLEKYAFSENVFNRQIVARGLLDVLREFSDNENDFISVMETVARMSEDGEPTVRAELMEQVPNIAMFLHENRPNFPEAFSRYLVPIVVRYLTDPNNQVRKTSQAALLVLLEQGLMSKADMEGKVCPVLLELTEPSSDDDYKIEAVAIMCKLVTMLTKDTVEHLLLLRFCELCSDVRLFQVRKVCAANFGEFCSIVGQEATEKLLMPKFFDLCSDSLWGIRKACAECFMVVSNCTSPEVRRTKLSPLFINLISDQSRWVRQAAFQSLGRFISTFANPSITGLHFSEDGTLREIPKISSENHGQEVTTSNSSNSRNASNDGSPDSFIQPRSEKLQSTSDLTCPPSHPKSNSSTQPQKDGTSLGPPERSAPLPHQQQDECTMFNSFNFWRAPLPDITQDLQLLKVEESDEVIEKQDDTIRETEGEGKENVPSLDAQGPATSSQIQKVLDCLQPHLDDPDVQAQVKVLSAALKAAQLESETEDADESVSESNGSTGSPTSDEISAMSELSLTDAQISDSPSSSPVLVDDSEHSSEESDLIENVEEDKDADTAKTCEEEKSKVQNVIPQQLLDQYLSMTDPARAQTVDTEIAKHCAFSLPGVALTLGRQNWHCLKDTYETLATDVQWKVRRTLAFSIHELAVILGDQLTAADLVPIFNGFLKDLDEVRIGVLKHLYDFLKLLHADKRREYLYQLQEFMVTDNSRNWRFRYELAEQLILIIELYSHNDVYDYLRQIALNLCSDKVSEVRWISYKLVVEILQKLYACEAHDLGLNFINELIMRFCHCPKWVGRQAFAFICQAVVEEDCMPMDQFAQHLLPSLLSLSSDPVPNVRVLVAKALRQSVLEKPYFKDPVSAYSDELEEALSELRMDKDRDVRFFATLDPNRNVMDTAALI
ncbi:serine threonine- phosphatase 4 regulatory subunit 1-like protein [Labeo rohita]|uniref:Serine threonine-phosphatase 4 regulatory subunit 1-like protein n=1 Tax=Labeo rohita TaxID=84645 RepID=A0A498NCX6_LABRO|nr:serine/threonine-protein phosphatase 4 regulatory subunit 1 [Labeo rohita]RXN27415.1 serine threonine- phosphatase 4 regulatory subunit 1-like protein [Labeo rohita]